MIADSEDSRKNQNGGKSPPQSTVKSYMMLAILFVVVLILAYANGSNDNFKAVATLYGSNTLSYRTSLIMASLAQILGSVASVFLAGSLIKTFSGKGLVPPEVVADSSFILAVGLGAAITVLLATRLGFPISTTHALIGGLVGSGLALAPSDLAWSNLGGKYFTPLLISPVLAILAAGTLYPIASFFRRKFKVDEVTCLCIGQTIEPVSITAEGALVAARTGLELSIEQAQSCEQRYVGSVVGLPAHRIVDALHIFSGFSLGFARGLNDTPKIMALLVAAAWSGMKDEMTLAIIAIAMCVGGLLQSARIAKTMGKRITEMNRGQGFIANFIASGLVIGASSLGMPVSTTHVSTGAIFGIGAWTGKSDWKVVSEIVLAWVITLPIAAGIGFIVAKASGLI